MTKIHRRRYPPRVYAEILERQDFRCACGCEEKIEDIGDVHYDHQVPLFLGGPDTPENLRALKVRHHLPKSRLETKARAKMNRIKARKGMLRKKVSAHDKAVARIAGLNTEGDQ